MRVFKTKPSGRGLGTGDRRREERDADVLEGLKDLGETTIYKLSDWLGRGRNQVAESLYAMKQQGLVDHSGERVGGTWKLV